MGKMTVEFLDAFAQAFNRHDVEAILAAMTEDCVFEASAGPDVCGRRYEGPRALGMDVQRDAGGRDAGGGHGLRHLHLSGR